MTPPTASPAMAPPARAAAPGWLGVAVFLAMSWTWCIGMFLPVLLVRDYGIWGWIIFAIPNVVGAAAMGWVLKDAGMSRRMVETHRPGCVAFSTVTIVFHAFFVGWVVRALVGESAGAWALAATVLLAATGSIRGWGDVRNAIVILGLSAVAMGGFVAITAAVPPPGGYDFIPAGPLNPFDLAGLAAACAVGFALCPYLDLTFHRAHQSRGTASAARRAFGAGFGGFFLLMILFTFLYAPYLKPTAAGLPSVPRGLAHCLALYMVLQSSFTVVVHCRAIDHSFHAGRQATVRGVVLGLAAGLATLLARWRPAGWAGPGVGASEVVYRCFMGFYGLIFPSYLLVFMVSGARSYRTTAWMGVIVAAGPFYAIAFLRGRMEWVLPGTAVMLVAPMILRAVTVRPSDARVQFGGTSPAPSRR